LQNLNDSPQKKDLRKKMLLLFISSLFCFLLGEIVVRFYITYDEDGNTWIEKRILLPFNLPVKEVQKNITKIKFSQKSIVVYNSLTGWMPRPNRQFNKLYIHNSVGLRVQSQEQQYTRIPLKNTLRIALFGDSYIYGDEVPFEETIGYFLQQELNSHGIKAEVINFGVGAYGIDQAYLRWYYEGQYFMPDIVISGFQPDNVFRNVNLIRAFYSKKEAFPFSKPRFIFKDDSLQLINQPTLLPDSLAVTISHMKTWKLSSYETFYKPEEYVKPFWYKSKLVSLIMNVIEINRWNIKKTETTEFGLHKEPALLTLKIMDVFKSKTEENGSSFFILHLPRKRDLSDIQNHQCLSYEGILNALDKKRMVIHPEENMLQASKKLGFANLFQAQEHYSGLASKAVAKEIFLFLIRKNAFNK
jgi:hypothetical protein